MNIQGYLKHRNDYHKYQVMSKQHNQQQICVLAKLVSDIVGYTSGIDYFLSLIGAVKQHLGLPYGFVYSIDADSRKSHRLIASSVNADNRSEPGTILDNLVLDLILENDNFVIIDLENDFEASDLQNPLSLKTVVSFPLYDSHKSFSGLIVFASPDVVIEHKTIIDVIETQIPRVSIELERMHIENKLRIYERNYNNLIDSSLDVIWETDMSGYISEINSACKEIYGHDAKRMIGKPYTDFMTDTSANKFQKNLNVVAQGQSLYNVPSDHITSQFEHIKVSYNIIPKYDNNHNVVGIIGATRDITSTARAQKTIKNNSELFSTILSRLPVIFFRVDEHGYLVDIRGNGLKRMGVDDLDWVGRPGYGLFIGMDEKIDSALSGNTVFFENRGTYGGTPWWFYTSMFFDSWSGYGAVGFSVDITEQKYVEEQLVELLNNNRKLAQTLVEVEEDERRTLARELHDELGQSITAVKSLATVITASAGEEYNEIRSLANSIIDLSAQLYEVVNNIMQRLRPDIIDGLDFSESIRNCIVRSQLETAGVNCKLDYSGKINDLEEVVKVTIYRIVQECLTNISKHAMASNVSIQIHRGTDNGDFIRTKLVDPASRDKSNAHAGKRDIVKIEVCDDGIGMNVEEKINTAKQVKRHGLQGINERVTAMGGVLEISARPGRGVRVQVVLVLGSSNYDVSHDINKCISDLREMRVETTEFKKFQAH